MSNVPITTFNAGELSPKVHDRVDIEKYSSGCIVLENMLPTMYGGVERRPGTKYVSGENPDKIKRLVPFIYSAEIAYILEFIDGSINVYYDDSLITSVSTTYDEDELYELQFAQVGDVLRIVHKFHPPAKLSRIGASEFLLEDIEFVKGPFLVRNDLANPDAVNLPTLACDVTETGDEGLVVATAPVFHDNHNGSIWQLTSPKSESHVSTTGNATSDPIDVFGTWTFTTGGTWTGTVKLQRNRKSLGWEDYRVYIGTKDRNIQQTFKESDTDVRYRIVPDPMTSKFRGEIQTDVVYSSGVIKIINVLSTTKAMIRVLSKLESTVATVRWAEGAWSHYRGWPASITFFQGRCCYGGAASKSDRSFGSEAMYPILRWSYA